MMVSASIHKNLTPSFRVTWIASRNVRGRLFIGIALLKAAILFVNRVGILLVFHRWLNVMYGSPAFQAGSLRVTNRGSHVTSSIPTSMTLFGKNLNLSVSHLLCPSRQVSIQNFIIDM